jgi:hypothetical protein
MLWGLDIYLKTSSTNSSILQIDWKSTIFQKTNAHLEVPVGLISSRLCIPRQGAHICCYCFGFGLVDVWEMQHGEGSRKTEKTLRDLMKKHGRTCHSEASFMTAETYQAVLRPLSPLHTCPITLCRLAA